MGSSYVGKFFRIRFELGEGNVFYQGDGVYGVKIGLWGIKIF